ncbi:MAG TPA: outer-membrane lipoprotein carrier protein LolA, partial [Pseudomonas sp.]|nr:outer-membrane lipoprotein carrier protein LolA [Pseudomonas sp.]
MRLIRLLLVAALSVSSLFAHAEDEVAVQRLTQLLNQAQTINARFSQLTLDGSGTQLQETAGQLALKRPGLFRWHTDEP